MRSTLPALFLLFVSCNAHPYYRDVIPNGYSVPSPCGGIWEAVGHYDPSHHTPEKNKFAQDFVKNGHKWTVALCQLDSDGDGKTNGEELGDPNCVWTSGTAEQPASGHPGLCEPLGQGACSTQPYYCGCHHHQCVGR